MKPALMAAAFAAFVSFESPVVVAYNNRPWCAVINLGPGDAYWDCQYRSVEECVPNVIAGNRGFCNPNPAFVGQSGPAQKFKARHKRPAG